MAILSGRRIAIAAPAGPAERKIVLSGAAELEKLGGEVKILPHVFAGNSDLKYLSAPDELRAAELTDAFLDENVDIIWCVRGGYGCMRILDKIPWQKLYKNPTIVAGFSDITALHWAMTACDAGVVLCAPMMKYLSGMDPDFTLKHLIAALENKPVEIVLEAVKMGNSVAGTVLPGNLCVAASLCGTKYFPELSGKILLLEEVGESPYRIDRMLTQLRLSGAFEHCRGVVFGKFTSCGEVAEIDAVLRDFARNITCPVFKNFPVGHEMPFFSLSGKQLFQLNIDAGSF